ncbi:MAG: class I SAM-dependent methyltransferase [Magnetospirillum sp. WYHS-4]
MALRCRVCASEGLELLVDIGPMPIAHRLRRRAEETEPRFPLRFHICDRCGLLQIARPIDPAVLYAEAETYSTAFQRPAHIPDLIATLLARRDPGPLLEIGCNDGTVLAAMKEHGFEDAIGIEPNRRMAERGRAAGLDIRTGFFGEADLGTGFHFVVARQVLEHVDALEPFVSGVRKALVPGGLFALELPQVESGLDTGNPAILWEEHVNYFTQPAIERLLALSGFRILDRRHYAFGGGSLALVAEFDPTLPLVPWTAADWNGVGPGRPDYAAFAAGLAAYRQGLSDLVAAYRLAGWRIALYGCAPRSVVVVNGCGIEASLDWAIDDRTEIQGRFLPGTDRAIVGLDALVPAPTLYLLGVGGENEYRVKRKIAARDGMQPRTASLFPPRDALGSIAAARKALSGSGLGVEQFALHLVGGA